VLQGEVILVTEAGNASSRAEMAADFPREDADGSARQQDEEGRLYRGDQGATPAPWDGATYADRWTSGRRRLAGGNWVYTHKDGSPTSER